ncbi:MAG: PsbP-related protein [Cyanobacteria bacterium P01_C01_bin.118]
MGALGIVITGPVYASSTVRHPVIQSAVADLHHALNVKQTEEFSRYDSDQFSVDYPREWQIESQGENSLAIVSVASGASMPIRTDIIVLREDPQVAVPQRIDQISAEALSVQRYSLVTVDGQSGFRIWYEPAPDQRALVTFVGYGNQQTVVLTSQYGSDTAVSAAVEDLVTQIHESFVNHAVARANLP